MYEQCIQKIWGDKYKYNSYKILCTNCFVQSKNIYSAPIDKFKRGMKRSDFYSMSILLEEKVNVCRTYHDAKYNE